MNQNLYRTKDIVLFEDSPEDAALLRRALGRAGVYFALKVIEDGAEALSYVKEATAGTKPDLIIIDLNMPKHDGFEILEALKKSPVLSGVPHAIFSSSISKRDREKAAGYGATEFVTKPAELNDFLETGMIFKSLLAIP